jgi:predicted ATP-grasp superfamily ATP-dependent carboligase
MAFVQLDTTLADLYHAHGISGLFIATMHCVFGHLDLDPEWPRETVYPVDGDPVPYGSDEREISQLKKTTLGLKPLQRAWGLGNMEVIFLSPYATAENMSRALNQLPTHQRHIPVFVDLRKGSVQEKLLELTRDRTLLFWRPQGWMRQHNLLIDTSEAYKINSKKYLITSAINTPASEMISLTDSDDFSSRKIPFVVKLCLAGSGFGTYLITTEDRRKKMLAAMIRYRERGGEEVLVSDYINPKEDLSVHFVIGAPDDENNQENPLILGVTVQNLTPDGHWAGGSIDYSAQAALAKYTLDTVKDTARKMPVSHVGWCGIDIVVDEAGKQWVVDLNARFTGSMPICFMSNHFWKDKGLPLAKFAMFKYGRAVDSIYDRLGHMVYSGQIVVTATAIIDQDLNVADVVWGGKDQADLASIGEFIAKSLKID